MFLASRVDRFGLARDGGDEVAEDLEGVGEAQPLELGRLIIAEELDESESVRESLRAQAVGEIRRHGGEELRPGAGEIRLGGRRWVAR